MCGICGKIYFDRNRKIQEEEFKKMTFSIYHRGPDDEGYYFNKNVALGFRRLSIIDLSTGHQPISNENDSIWITFNGEIYNYQNLRKDLINQGYKFKTNTDTEVILHLYERYKEKCVDYLEGMYAFVIWDENSKILFGARDRFGIKPFYYYIDNEKLIWASEIKVILKDPKVKTSVNLRSLNEYLAYGYLAGSNTIYNEIKKLPPAHRFSINLNTPDKIQVDKYWTISFNHDLSKTEKQWIDEIEFAFSESVKKHMISDVPLGAFLSGGIDSSAVVAFMSKHSQMPVKTFSIGFNEKKFSELEYARIVANLYKTEHYEMIVEPESIELLPKLISAYDEPFADSSVVPTYYVSKFAKQYVKVVLSGDGGDEFFAGYQKYQKFMNILRNPLYGKFQSKLFWKPIHGLLPDSMYGKGLAYYYSLSQTPFNLFANIFKDYERQKLLKYNKEFEKDFALQNRINILSEIDYPTELEKMQTFDLLMYMPEDILLKVDRASMLNSLEARVPIIDHKFAELIFKLPPAFKFRDQKKKYIFRQMLAKYLPPEILDRPKRGFEAPLSIWFKNDLNTYINDLLLNKNNGMYEWVEFSYVKKVLNDHMKGMRDFSGKIWSLLVLGTWCEQNKSNI